MAVLLDIYMYVVPFTKDNTSRTGIFVVVVVVVVFFVFGKVCGVSNLFLYSE